MRDDYFVQEVAHVESLLVLGVIRVAEVAVFWLKEQLCSQDALEIQKQSSTNDVSHHHTLVPVFGKQDNGRDLNFYSFEHNPEKLESLLCTFVDPCLLDFSRTSNSAEFFILKSFLFNKYIN